MAAPKKKSAEKKSAKKSVADTRKGDVYTRLLEKLEQQRVGLGSRVKVEPVPKPLVAWVAAGSSGADWRALVADEDALVRVRVALNSYAPSDVVEHLVGDPVWFVRWVAARRPGGDVRVRGEVLASLASDELVEVRMLVAADPLTPVGVLEVLAGDKSKYVRVGVAWNPSTPVAVLEVLARDEDNSVRCGVAWNPSSPVQVLGGLAVDGDEVVRSLVWGNPVASQEVRASAALIGVHQSDPEYRDTEELEEELGFIRVWGSVMRAGEVATGVGPGVGDRVWSVGETGPGGGVVFFDAGERLWWGRYLEAAPAGWAGSSAEHPHGPDDPRLSWGSGNVGDTSTQVGWGLWNTWRIVERMGPVSAAGVATSYRGGGYTDWFLPSRDELNALDRQRTVGGLPGAYFWSSSQFGKSKVRAWAQGFAIGYKTAYTCCDFHVRPVRAF